MPLRAAFGQFSQLSFSESVRTSFNRFEIGHGFVPKYRFQICTLAVLDRFVICHFWSNTPYRLQICHPQIVSYFSTDSRFVGDSGVDKLQNCTGRQIPNLSDRRKYRFQICQPQNPPTDFKSVTCTVSNLVGTRLGSDKTQICKVQSQPLRPWNACQQSTPSCQVSG